MVEVPYSGLEQVDYDLDDDDDDEPFDLNGYVKRVREWEPSTPGEQRQKGYWLRKAEDHRKTLVELEDLRAWKADYTKKELATDIAAWFTSEGLSPGDAVAYLSTTPRDEMTFDHVQQHIDALKERK